MIHFDPEIIDVLIWLDQKFLHGCNQMCKHERIIIYRKKMKAKTSDNQLTEMKEKIELFAWEIDNRAIENFKLQSSTQTIQIQQPDVRWTSWLYRSWERVNALSLQTANVNFAIRNWGAHQTSSG